MLSALRATNCFHPASGSSVAESRRRPRPGALPSEFEYTFDEEKTDAKFKWLERGRGGRGGEGAKYTRQFRVFCLALYATTELANLRAEENTSYCRNNRVQTIPPRLKSRHDDVTTGAGGSGR